jgi:HEAT repeat protein
MQIRYRLYIPAISLLLALPAGCAHEAGSKSWFSRKNSRDYTNMALEADSPDERRKGVNGLAASSDATSDWAVKVFDTIARTDTNAAVRCAAVKALSVSALPESTATIIKILKTPSETFPDVKPATPALRWEAAKVLNVMAAAQIDNKTQEQEILKLLLDRLGKETDRNVRLEYIDTLAMFPQRPVPETLVDTLGEEDFAISRAAEKSLIALTGVTHHQNPQQWRDWLAKNENPFAHAGEVPAEAEVKSKSNWDW